MGDRRCPRNVDTPGPVFAYRKMLVSHSFQLSQFYPSPKLGQLFYPAEMSVNTLSVNALSVKADAAGAASQICKHPPYPLSNCGVCP